MASTVYFVTALAEAASVGARIKKIIPAENLYELAPDKWMVSYDGPTQDLAERAGVRTGDEFIASGLVLPVTTYSGRAPTGLWDWLRGKGL